MTAHRRLLHFSKSVSMKSGMARGAFHAGAAGRVLHLIWR